MTRRADRVVLGVTLTCGLLTTSPTRAASALDDLQAVLSLRDAPCAMVTSFERADENDYIVHCSGNRDWRVWLDSQGRVRVEKR